MFQALRIAVNDEMGALEESLKKSVDLLSSQGRLVIISFHSLEDKFAKNLSKNQSLKSISAEPISPSEEEISLNTPSRSAKMRVYEKL